MEKNKRVSAGIGGQLIIISLSLFFMLASFSAWSQTTIGSDQSAPQALAPAQAITPGPVPDELIVTEGGLKWVWASPCIQGGCSDPDPNNQEGWRFATDDELAIRPACEAFQRPDLTTRCASEYFDPNFTNCDYNDCLVGGIGSAPGQICFQGQANGNCESWYVMDVEVLEKEIVDGTDLNNDGVPDLAVEVGILTPSTYDFKLTYENPNGPDVLIEDAIPAEWDVVVAEAVDGVVENGDFESGDFTGWSQFNSGSGGIVIDDGTYDPAGPGGPVAPFEGSYGSVTFQGGPGLHILFQDVDVPLYGMPTLVWADHIQNWAGNYSIPNQQWRVEVRDPSDDSVIAILRETLPGDALQQPWTVYTADLSPWAGTTVRIAFVEQDNLSFFNARLDAVDVVNDPNMLNCVLESANKKNNGKSATLASCYPEGSGMTVFSTIARCHDNKKNKKCRPTSCGALYLNDGAEAFELDEFGDPLVDEFGDRLPPILTSNNLCLVAVPDLNGGGIDYTGGGDEDNDGATDHEEACAIGTDPCDDDSDDDGVLDGADECPLEGPPDASIGEVQDPNGCNRQSQCSDGIDNDDDGPIDFGADASCDSIDDDSEDTNDCSCWNSNDLLNVTAANEDVGNSCSTRPDTEALIQNIPGSTPGLQGGFAADSVSIFGTGAPGCSTRDPSQVNIPTTAQEAAVCAAQIKQRCEDIGDPIPLAPLAEAPLTADADGNRGFE